MQILWLEDYKAATGDLNNSAITRPSDSLSNFNSSGIRWLSRRSGIRQADQLYVSLLFVHLKRTLIGDSWKVMKFDSLSKVLPTPLHCKYRCFLRCPWYPLCVIYDIHTNRNWCGSNPTKGTAMISHDIERCYWHYIMFAIILIAVPDTT